MVAAHPYFYLPAFGIVLTSLLAYNIYLNLPLPKDRFTIAISIHPVPDEIEKEAQIIRQKISDDLSDRMEKYAIKGSTILLREKINLEDTSRLPKLAALIKKHYRAHIVIFGTVMKDVEKDLKLEYSFRPRVFNFVPTTYQFSPSGEKVDSDEIIELPTPEALLTFKDRKASDVADLATFVCALAMIKRGDYSKSKQVLDAISEPTAEMFFYRGFSYLKLGEYAAALVDFESSASLEPTMTFAYLCGGIAAEELGDEVKAQGLYTEGKRVSQENIRPDRVRQDETVAREILNRILMRFADRMIETSVEIQKGYRNFADSWEISRKKFDYKIEAEEFLYKEDYQNALDSLDRLLALEPDNLKALASRAYVLAKLDRAEEARQAGDKASKASEQEQLLAQSGELGSTGAVPRESDWPEELIDKYGEEQLRAINAIDRVAYKKDLARAYALLGDETRTLGLIAEIVQADPTYKVEASLITPEFENLRDNEYFRRITA
jgi:tetratricopeptide (TPR) repeat protein